MVHHRLRHLCDASPLSGGEDTERVSCSVSSPPSSSLVQFVSFSPKHLFFCELTTRGLQVCGSEVRSLPPTGEV